MSTMYGRKKFRGMIVQQTDREQKQDFNANDFNSIDSDFEFPFDVKITRIRESTLGLKYKLDGEVIQFLCEAKKGSKLVVFLYGSPGLENFKQIQPQIITIPLEYIYEAPRSKGM